MSHLLHGLQCCSEYHNKNPLKFYPSMIQNDTNMKEWKMMIQVQLFTFLFFYLHIIFSFIFT